MEKTKIDWVDSSWNPITGCLHGCQYCYARAMANRYACIGYPRKADKDYAIAYKDYQMPLYGSENNLFEVDTPLFQKTAKGNFVKAPYPFKFKPTFHRYRLNDYMDKKGRSIFVCSMADIFGQWVPDAWIQDIFTACTAAPQHMYLFLTKNPSRYRDLKNLPKNAMFGTTITSLENRAYDNAAAMTLTPYGQRFLSIEPLLGPVGTVVYSYPTNWVIVGAETGNRKEKVIPKRKWIEDIVSQCRKANIPIFMKSSLREIMGEDFIQEHPKGMHHLKGE